MKSFGLEESEARTRALSMLSMHDEDQNGTIDQQEFLVACAIDDLEHDDGSLRTLFASIDKNGDGQVDRQDLLSFCTRLQNAFISI
jgi:Ca2+-binding EF-hand superfamily protein